MDSDSSTKFIASLTKFLQSLCNGYVEFQNGVELAGHIYLSIDTGEKVDYILHEKVCKNDENSVTFISNSFHALPADKRKDGKQPEQSKDAQSKTSAKSDARSKDDDDVVILDHDSSSSGTSSRGMKRSASPGLDQRHRTSGQRNASGSLQGSGARQGSRGIRQQPSATVTSQDEQRGENFDAGDVKLEQMTTDELLSLASQVSDTPGGPPHRTSAASHRRTTPPRPRNSREAPQEMWIKQEVTDDADVPGGSDSGQSWPHGRDDSNSGPGGGLYPVMLHQNTAAFSPTGFPVFPTTSQHHGLGQPLPSTSSASHPYANPIPGTSQGAGAVDPAVSVHQRPSIMESDKGTFTTSNRGKRCLLVDGFKYRVYDVVKGGNVAWRCNNKSCRARLQTDRSGKIVAEIHKEHNHETALRKKMKEMGVT